MMIVYCEMRVMCFVELVVIWTSVGNARDLMKNKVTLRYLKTGVVELNPILLHNVKSGDYHHRT